MHAPEHSSPSCSCECSDCQLAGPHAAGSHHSGDVAQAIAAERDPVTPELEAERYRALEGDVGPLTEAEWRLLDGNR